MKKEYLEQSFFVDLDDTMCIYTNAWKEELLKNKGIKYPQSKIGFFENLKPFENAIETYKWLNKHVDTWILTRPSYQNPNSYSEKRIWVEKHLGLDVCKKLIICPVKSLLKGGVLIDDRIHEGWNGEHIHFGSDKFPDWLTIKKYLNE